MSIVIYTKEDCAYCAMAKNLLKSKNITYSEKVLSIDYTREELLSKYSLAKTFPVIVVDGFYIGGYNNLVEHVDRLATTQVLLAETVSDPIPEPTVEVTPEETVVEEAPVLPTKMSRKYSS